MTLGVSNLLLVGVDKLGGWSLLLVGAIKSRSWRFLLVDVGKYIECNKYIIKTYFVVFPPLLGFPRKNIMYCV